MKKVFLICLYLMAPLLPIIALFNLNPQKYSSFQGALPMVLGSCAFTWLMFQFVFSARPKFIEKHFGMDRIYIFHGYMAVVSVCIAFIHKIIQGEGTLGADIGEKALLVFIVVTGLTLLLMIDSPIVKIPIIPIIRKIVMKIKLFKYENYLLFHRLTLVGLVLIYIHVLLSYAAGQFLVMKIIYTAYFLTGLSFYLVHKFFKTKDKYDKPYKVANIVEESTSMTTIYFESLKKRKLMYIPGQFAFFRFFGENISNEAHPFSISSGGGNELSVTIKSLGDYTSKIRNIKVGDRASIEGPYGVFSYVNYPNEKELVFIAGGVGITPILSMIRHLSQNNKDKKVLLIWGVSTVGDFRAGEEITKIKEIMPNLEYLPVLSGPEEWNGKRGYVSTELVFEELKKYNFDINKTGIYVCGPAIMSEKIVADLRKNSRDKSGRNGIVKSKNIHYEKFSL